jgi:Protein of unknown function (DUF3179)
VRDHTRWLWAGLTLSVLTALIVVGVPVWHIRPFRPQTTTGMAWSYTLRQLAPGVTIAAAATACLCALLLSRRVAGWRSAVAGLVVMPSLALAWFAHQNHFEWMFNPLEDQIYVPAAEASFLDPDDIVLAVQIEGEAIAYPVRQLAYHHLVNAVVGGAPITATY